MSFPSVATYQQTKNVDLFGQGCEDLDSDFFDQFLNFSPHSTGGEYSTAPENHGFEQSVTDSNSVETISSHDDDAKNSSDHHSGQGGAWAKGLSAASFQCIPGQGNGFYAELSGRAAISDSELLSLEGIDLNPLQMSAHSQLSLPTTPSPAVAAVVRKKARLLDSISKSLKKASGSIERSLRSPIRKTNSLPKMRRSNHSQTDIDQVENKFETDALKFKFDFEENPSFIYPVSSAKQSEDCVMEDPMKEEYPRVYTSSTTPRKTARFTSNDTPVATPELSAHSRKTSFQHLGSEDALFPITPELQSSATFWPQIQRSTDTSTCESSSMYSSAELDTPIWWNHAAQAPMAQPLPTGFHTNPQLATKSLALQLQNGLAYDANNHLSSRKQMNIATNGFMIQMSRYPNNQSYVVGDTPQQQGYFNGATTNGSAQQRQHNHHARRHSSQASSRHSHPRPYHPNGNANGTTPMRKNRSTSSIHSSDSPSPSSPHHHVRKRKSPKTKHSSSAPRTSSTLDGAVDFVNYTPDDSKKILTGVAPSGSSKTKARREKEAMEKRRKVYLNWKAVE
ncbi:hypothetical protein G7Y89_g8329 [Cudoniella acicularis]|uniref:Developmental regulatory protein wetA n=1 Tax=Cudoniella acicularis TaxID=354080 RepID=A0A8H4RHN6_9HELO|nr:hypothetical protein G7Y89_g8329 [Cudoniella acicularis]